MSLKDDLTETVDQITADPYDVRRSSKVPATTDVLYGQGVSIAATYLYADMVDCSGLNAACGPDEVATAAKVIRLFLDVSVRIIKSHGGEIRSFDGDRVMGIFVGDSRQDRAVMSAMQIKWACQKLLQPKIDETYDVLAAAGWKLKPGCGIASGGRTLVVRGGVRHQDNDLVSVGVSPNLAAKMSDYREGSYSIVISKATYENLTDVAKLSKGVDMWETGPEISMGGTNYPSWKSSYRWKIT